MWQVWFGISITIFIICAVYTITTIYIYKSLRKLEGNLYEKLISIQLLKEKVATGCPIRLLYDEIEVYNRNVESYNKSLQNILCRRIAKKYGIERKEKYLKM